MIWIIEFTSFIKWDICEPCTQRLETPFKIYSYDTYETFTKTQLFFGHKISKIFSKILYL